MKIYGIKNCDTCRKALNWLREQGIAHEWVDLREQPPTTARLSRWLQAVGHEHLVNRRSTTWRGLDEAARAQAVSSGVAALLAEHPTLIKRPVFEYDGEVCVGFTGDVRESLVKYAG